MGYLSRQPTSNDPPRKKGGKWLDTNDIDDAISLMLSGRAKRCAGCNNPISLRFLVGGKCPDCKEG